MASKFQLITEIYEETTQKVCESPTAWTAFLRSACRNYKCRFDEQILIYAQRPEATAVLEIEKWNKQFGRWVNKGATGIAVFNDERRSKSYLKHYFDISDTHGSRFERTVPIWTMKIEYESEVIESLENSFGELSDNTNLSDSLISVANNIVQDNYADYFYTLKHNRDDSFLEELDEFNVEVEYLSILKSGVAYMLLTRCGIDADEYFEIEDFQNITYFNTPQTLNALGLATSDIAEMCLREIAITVWNKQKQGKTENRTFAIQSETAHNVPQGKNNERGNDNGSDISDGGRLQNTQSGDAGRSGNNPWQIRIDAGKTSETEQPGDVRKLVDISETERAPDGNRAIGDGDDGTDDIEDGGGARSDRESQSDRPDEVGGSDEQYPTRGRGNDTQRPDIRVKPLPTVQQQRELLGEAEDTAKAENSASSLLPNVPQDVIDDALISDYKDDSIFQPKFRIYHNFKRLNSDYEFVQFLKNDYGISGRPSFIDRSFRLSYNAKGITFSKGDILNPDIKAVLSWEKAAKRVREMLNADILITPHEMEKLYPQYLEAVSPRQHVIRLGSAVIIGTQEYEVLEFDENNVTLIDKQFPLLSVEMLREEFDRKLRENPLNDNLIQTVLSEQEARNEKVPEVSVAKVPIKVPQSDVLPPDDSIVPAWEKKKTQVRRQDYNIHPEIPMSERHNYRITDDDLGAGGSKTKFRFNVEAIRTLQKIEQENRFATPEEQEILSKYVGWGGLQQAFDADNPQWVNEYAELSSLISPDEYENARASTLNAHYTSPVVIKAIYKALENMGFKSGNILEPSCGTGNFFGLLPQSMGDSKLYGVELDGLTGRIAQQLYQKNSVLIQGFEDTSLPDSFFDIAIGNVPFGAYSVVDKKYDRHKFRIHEYFFAKTIDKVRPGGVIAFVTSMYTLDKKNPSVRKYIAQRAELLGAIRLPNNAFLKNAGTEVTTDIIFLQKRDRVMDVEPEWVHLEKIRRYKLTLNDYDQFGIMDIKSGNICDSGKGVWFENRWDAEKALKSFQDNDPEAFTINAYFVSNPDMILGTLSTESGTRMYGSETSISCVPFPNADLSEQLAEAITNIHADITEYERDEDLAEEDNSIPADPNVRNFSYTIHENQIYFRQDSRMVPAQLPITAQNRVRGLIELRECVRNLIMFQNEDFPENTIKAEQAKLGRLYDSYTKKYGIINSRGNSMAFSQDSSYCLLCSLEVLNENGGLERKADIFSKRTISPTLVVESVDTSSEALAVSLSEKAKVDLEYMTKLCGKSEETIITELEGVIFLNVDNELSNEAEYVTADEYLSGNVREKLKSAKAAASNMPSLEVNVRALEAVVPPDLTAVEINVRLGATWVPEDVR